MGIVSTESVNCVILGLQYISESSSHAYINSDSVEDQLFNSSEEHLKEELAQVCSKMQFPLSLLAVTSVLQCATAGTVATITKLTTVTHTTFVTMTTNPLLSPEIKIQGNEQWTPDATVLATGPGTPVPSWAGEVQTPIDTPVSQTPGEGPDKGKFGMGIVLGILGAIVGLSLIGCIFFCYKKEAWCFGTGGPSDKKVLANLRAMEQGPSTFKGPTELPYPARYSENGGRGPTELGPPRPVANPGEQSTGHGAGVDDRRASMTIC
jgi:hypothetical protein